MMTPLQITRSVRSLNRLRRIAQVLTQHGFGYVVARANLGRFLPVWMLRKSQQRSALAETPANIGRRIAQVCTELGPTFIKFAQLLTTRPDIVPPDVLTELRKLQDAVPPFDSAVAMTTIAEQLGQSISDSFSSIDESPMASGSIGQVHRAVTLEGIEVIVKVQRPEIGDTIALDMQLLRWLAETLESLMPELSAYRPQMLVAELEQALTRELDYVNEASATARFHKAFQDDPGIRTPEVFWELCAARVLTIEALPGCNVSNVLERTATGQAPPSLDRPLVARRLTECFLKQVFEIGLFHADPHPGNILIDPPSSIGLIDFGQVGIITDELMTQMAVMVFAAVNREFDVVVDSLADLGALGVATDRRQLHRSLQSLLDKYYGLPLKRIDLATVTTEFAEVVRQHDVTIPSDVLLLFKALGLVTASAAALDPNLDVLEPLGKRLRQVMRERVSPKRLAREGAVWGWHLLSMARLAPRQLRDGLRRIGLGGWKINIRHENIERLVNELDRSSNRLSFAVVIAAIIVGSSIVVSADSALTVFDIKFQYFGIVGYLMAGVLGLGLAWAIFRSGRLH